MARHATISWRESFAVYRGPRVIAMLLAATFVRIRCSPRQRSLQTRFSLNLPTATRLHLFSLAAIPLTATTLAVGLLSRLGMDRYHSFQFTWRYEFMLFFCVVVVVSECLPGDRSRSRVVPIVPAIETQSRIRCFPVRTKPRFPPWVFAEFAGPEQTPACPVSAASSASPRGA